MINKYDAQEIATGTADAFRVRVTHRSETITTEEYDLIVKTCLGILEAKLNNINLQGDDDAV